MEILLAEDERVFRASLKDLLEANGYAVRAVANGEKALAAYRERRPDLLLLDVMMPVKGGYETCEEIRRTDVETPILFLTALDSDEAELKGLGVGADQYISKTVSNDVLLGRIAAVVRRRRRDEPSGDFDFADWHVEAESLSMRRGSDGPVSLNEREVAVLRWFAAHPGSVFTRDFLCTKFWGADCESDEGVVTVFVHRLRSKLGKAGATLMAVHGVGYAYRP